VLRSLPQGDCAAHDRTAHQDGRIHPARIEEIAEKVKKELETP